MLHALFAGVGILAVVAGTIIAALLLAVCKEVAVGFLPQLLRRSGGTFFSSLYIIFPLVVALAVIVTVVQLGGFVTAVVSLVFGIGDDVAHRDKGERIVVGVRVSPPG